MLKWNKKCVKEMVYLKNFRFLESIQGFFPTLFIIIIFNPSPFLTFDYLYLFPLLIVILLNHQFVYVINDFYDFPTDLNNPRKTYTRSISQQKRLIFIFLIILINLLTFKIYNNHLSILILNSFFFFLGVLYSHPVTHFKSSRPLSFLIHFVYGFLGSSIGHLILIDLNLIKKISPLLFTLSGSIFGFLFLAGNIMSAIIDQNIEPNSWIKNSALFQLNYYKKTLYLCIFLLAIFYVLQVKKHTILLFPFFLAIFLSLHKLFNKDSLYKKNQEVSVLIRDKVRLYFFLFFIFQLACSFYFFKG
tara:strand:+ start:669 stop:1577 length:909 start_codon:yes stop_codon:yes gene_type:complete